MMKQILISSLAFFCVVGCASNHQPRPANTISQIGNEMQTAVDARAKPVDEAVNRAMLPAMNVDLPAPEPVLEPRFNLAVSNGPIHQVYMALVNDTRYSMLVSPEVTGNITVNLKNVTVREALETIRELYGYDFKYQGTRIYITPNTMQTRLFKINYLSGKRRGQSDLRVTSGSVAMNSAGSSSSTGGTGSSSSSTSANDTSVMPSSQVSTTSDHDFWRELTQSLTALVGQKDGRNIVINPGSGVLLVRAFPAELRAVEEYLKATQVIVERQVMLEAKIIEVTLNDEFSAGVNWSWFGGSSNRFGVGVASQAVTLGTSGSLSTSGVSMTPGTNGAMTTTSGFLGLAFQSTNFASLINFLETQGNVQVLSSPRIATINNQKAVLKVGTDDYFVTGVSSGSTSTSNTTTTTTNTAPTITVQSFFSGIALDVTPQIDESNNIILHVHPTVSVVTEKQKSINLGVLGDYSLPLASSTINESDSVVRVQDGNIVAIGGLMKQEQSASRTGLPGAESTGLLNGLFGQRTSSLKKQELVILIKPTVIQNESDWKEDLKETRSRFEQYDTRQVAPVTKVIKE